MLIGSAARPNMATALSTVANVEELFPVAKSSGKDILQSLDPPMSHFSCS
jgi:hypothetical protein